MRNKQKILMPFQARNLCKQQDLSVTRPAQTVNWYDLTYSTIEKIIAASALGVFAIFALKYGLEDQKKDFSAYGIIIVAAFTALTSAFLLVAPAGKFLGVFTKEKKLKEFSLRNVVIVIGLILYTYFLLMGIYKAALMMPLKNDLDIDQIKQSLRNQTVVLENQKDVLNSISRDISNISISLNKHKK